MYQLLLIDDSSIDAMLFESALEESGQQAAVTIFLDSVAGLNYLREHARDIDGVVLDLNMPGLDGFGVLQAIESLEHKPPVIVMSTSDAQGDKVRSLELGASRFITKPLQFEDLIAVTRNIVPVGL